MEFDKASPFAHLQSIVDKHSKQLQIPGLEDAVETVQAVEESRLAAIQKRDPEIERIYHLASERPENFADAQTLLGEVADALYRLLY